MEHQEPYAGRQPPKKMIQQALPTTADGNYEPSLYGLLVQGSIRKLIQYGDMACMLCRLCLYVFVYMLVYLCMSLYMCLYMSVYVVLYVFVYVVYVCICLYMCICVYMFLCIVNVVYIGVYVVVNVCTCLCICLCIMLYMCL